MDTDKELTNEQLVQQYVELQREVIERGLPVLPEHITVGEWQRKRKDSLRFRSTCTRALQTGRIPGALNLGDLGASGKGGQVYMIPKRAKPIIGRLNAKRRTPSSKTPDGVKL